MEDNIPLYLDLVKSLVSNKKLTVCKLAISNNIKEGRLKSFIKNDLKDIDIDLYNQYLYKGNIEKQKKENLVRDFVNSNETLKNFKINNNISHYEWNLALISVKANNKSLYQEYIVKPKSNLKTSLWSKKPLSLSDIVIKVIKEHLKTKDSIVFLANKYNVKSKAIYDFISNHPKHRFVKLYKKSKQQKSIPNHDKKEQKSPLIENQKTKLLSIKQQEKIKIIEDYLDENVNEFFMSFCQKNNILAQSMYSFINNMLKQNMYLDLIQRYKEKNSQFKNKNKKKPLFHERIKILEDYLDESVNEDFTSFCDKKNISRRNMYNFITCMVQKNLHLDLIQRYKDKVSLFQYAGRPKESDVQQKTKINIIEDYLDESVNESFTSFCQKNNISVSNMYNFVFRLAKQNNHSDLIAKYRKKCLMFNIIEKRKQLTIKNEPEIIKFIEDYINEDSRENFASFCKIRNVSVQSMYNSIGNMMRSNKHPELIKKYKDKQLLLHNKLALKQELKSNLKSNPDMTLKEFCDKYDIK